MDDKGDPVSTSRHNARTFGCHEDYPPLALRAGAHLQLSVEDEKRLYELWAASPPTKAERMRARIAHAQVERFWISLDIAMAGESEPPPSIPLPAEPIIPAAPRTGEILIGLFCGRDRREDMLAVLADRFEDKARYRGARYARRWYWREVARSFGPFAWQWARRLVELDALLKLIGF